LTFKNKKNEFEINKILLLSQYYSLGLTRKNINSDFFKNKDILFDIKSRLLKHYYEVINKENNINNSIQRKSIFSKALVIDGNNNMLIKSLLKQRYNKKSVVDF